MQTDDQVTQRTVPARGAPPLARTGAASVFAWGQSVQNGGSASAEPEAPDARPSSRNGGGAIAAVREALEQHHELTASKIAGITKLKETYARKILQQLQTDGVIGIVRKEGKAVVYALRDRQPTGFKGWLKRRGEASAEGRAPRKAKASRKAAAAAPPAPRPKQRLARPPVTAVAVPVEAPPVTCGLFSTGELVIEAGGQQMRLQRDQARALLAWLLKVDAALQP